MRKMINKTNETMAAIGTMNQTMERNCLDEILSVRNVQKDLDLQKLIEEITDRKAAGTATDGVEGAGESITDESITGESSAVGSITDKWIDIARKIAGRDISKMICSVSLAKKDEKGKIDYMIDFSATVENTIIKKNSKRIYCVGEDENKTCYTAIEVDLSEIIFLNLKRIGCYGGKLDVYRLVFVTDDSYASGANYIYNIVLYINK